MTEMKRILKTVLAMGLVVASMNESQAQERVVMESSADEIVTLWDNSTAKFSNQETRNEVAKGRKISNTSSADLYLFKASKENANGYGIVIVPGGSYRNVSFSTMFAEWLRENGVTAAVLKYRLPNYGHKEASYEDASGAVEYLRNNAADLNLDVKKIGICGSSAGGHLAAWVSATAKGVQRPDFAILVYGAMERSVFWAGSDATQRLVGKDITAAKVKAMDVSGMVDENTPPTLLLLSDDDLTVFPQSSTMYYKALKDHGVEAAMHIYPSGGHGWFGKMDWKYRDSWLGEVKRWLSFLESDRSNPPTPPGKRELVCRADEEIRVWDNSTAPHSNEETEKEYIDEKNVYRETSETRFYVFKADPAKATGQAVVVIPGGGYRGVYIEFEGYAIAEYFKSIGVTAVVVKYRLPNYGHKEVPLEDIQEALSFVRKNAKRLNVDPAQVGVCGGSAGGHLAAYTSTFTPDKDKPAFSILFYPVIHGSSWESHQDSFAHLLGKKRTIADQEYYSLENRVTKTTPPTLLLLSDDDAEVPTLSSILYYNALKYNGVPASMHIYPNEGHGWAAKPWCTCWDAAKPVIQDWLSILQK